MGKFFYRLLLLLLTVLLFLSGRELLLSGADSVRQDAVYDALSARVARERIGSSPTEAAAPPAAEPEVLPEYADLYGENPDLAGWLTIDGTPIDYPVTQSQEPDYYLHRNFKKEESAHGCLYAKESCDLFAPSDNVIIYGHRMRDGSMFAGLAKYRSEAFFRDHPAFRFDTIYERHTYTIFAVFTTTATKDAGFAYHLFENAADKAEFDGFVSTCKALSLYDTGITPMYGDKLLCLSTCEYSQANGRLVVAAVRDETPHPIHGGITN